MNPIGGRAPEQCDESARIPDHPGISPGLTMTSDPAAPRWVVVVRPERLDVLVQLSRTFQRATWVSVLSDRRRGQRRRHQVDVGKDLRVEDRRGTADDWTQRPSYRLARRGDGFDVCEATGFALARCVECGETVMFEMPRSSEPPRRVDLRVVHEQGESRPRTRHAVELLLYASGERPLLACRCLARTYVDVIGPEFGRCEAVGAGRLGEVRGAR